MALTELELDRARDLEKRLYMQIVSPAGFVQESLVMHVTNENPLDAWRTVTPVSEAIALLDEGLALLGDRTGERAASTRATLAARRDALQSARDAYESLGSQLDGQAARVLITRVAQLRAARKEAERTVELASRDTVIESLAELERVLCDGRALCRELVALGRAVAYPKEKSLPRREDFERAKASTLALANRPGKRPGVIDQQTALEQGAKATAAEALYWPVFEPAEPHALLTLRFDRYRAGLEPSTAQAAE